MKLKYPYKVNKFERIVIEITNYCPVQCSFCWMNADANLDNSKKLSTKAIEHLVQFTKDTHIPIFDITGGEPLSELDIVTYLIQNINAKKFSISTSGYFATTTKKSHLIFKQLADSIKEHKNKFNKNITIDIKVSVDQFHWHVTKNTLINIINDFKDNFRDSYKNMHLELRCILADNEPITEFIQQIGGTIQYIEKSVFYKITKISLSDSDLIFNLKFQELRLTDSLIDSSIININFSNNFYDRINTNPIKIGVCKNEGVYLFINYLGDISLHAFLSRCLKLSNINDENFELKLKKYLFFNPLIVALRELGLQKVVEIAKEINPDIINKSFKANNIYMIICDIIKTKKINEYVNKNLIYLLNKKK